MSTSANSLGHMLDSFHVKASRPMAGMGRIGSGKVLLGSRGPGSAKLKGWIFQHIRGTAPWDDINTLSPLSSSLSSGRPVHPWGSLAPTGLPGAGRYGHRIVTGGLCLLGMVDWHHRSLAENC